MFNKCIEENLLNLKNEMPIKVWETYRTPDRQGQKRNSPQQIVLKTINVYNTKRALKTPKENEQVTQRQVCGDKT